MSLQQNAPIITWRKSESQIPVDKLIATAQTLLGLAAARSTGQEAAESEALSTEAKTLEQLVAGLRTHLRCGELIANISNTLLNLPLDELEAGVKAALAELGAITGVQRTYVFFLSDDGRCLADAHEWCAPGIPGHDFGSFFGVSVAVFPWSMRQFLRAETVFVDNPDELPPEAAAERGACEALSIRSYVNMPLFLSGAMIGWIGFDSVTEHKRWTEEELRYMTIAGDIIVSALQRKRRDELLFRQRELSQRVTSMGTLAAGLAHEINNPLSFVIGNLSYLRELVDEPPTRQAMSELREVIAHTSEGADRVRRIVSDLRALARGEDTQIEEVDVKAVAESTLRMVSNQLRHRARVVCNFGNDMPLAQANASQLGQIFLNIILNAAQAMPEGRVAENELRITTQALDKWVKIDVQDTGCGIPADRLSRIFDPFYTTRQVGGGMGIGLAICYTLVRSFGGAIEVDSTVGAGTTVTILLPQAGAHTIQTADPGTRPRATVMGDRLRLLIVDDEPRVLDMLTRMLRGNDISVAHDGREALSMLGQDHAYDIILCDLMMPNMTGKDVYEELRQSRPQLAERMIFISGGALSNETRHFLDSVPNRRLTKPFEVDVVRREVQAAAQALAQAGAS